jgi:hypothetical protein
MVSFTFSAEEVRAAPPEVRRWIEAQALPALGLRPGSEARPSTPEHGALADCSPEEIAQVLKLISENMLVTRIFFELARDALTGPQVVPYHALGLAEIQHQAQLAEPEQLFTCLGAINQALRTVRGDAEVSMFGFDDAGHLYLHEATHRSIRQIWGQLLQAHSAAMRPVAEAGMPEVVPRGTTAPHEPRMRPEHAFASNLPFGAAD